MQVDSKDSRAAKATSPATTPMQSRQTIRRSTFSPRGSPVLGSSPPNEDLFFEEGDATFLDDSEIAGIPGPQSPTQAVATNEGSDIMLQLQEAAYQEEIPETPPPTEPPASTSRASCRARSTSTPKRPVSSDLRGLTPHDPMEIDWAMRERESLMVPPRGFGFGILEGGILDLFSIYIGSMHTAPAAGWVCGMGLKLHSNGVFGPLSNIPGEFRQAVTYTTTRVNLINTVTVIEVSSFLILCFDGLGKSAGQPLSGPTSALHFRVTITPQLLHFDQVCRLLQSLPSLEALVQGPRKSDACVGGLSGAVQLPTWPGIPSPFELDFAGNGWAK
jgi:hypothetical protein